MQREIKFKIFFPEKKIMNGPYNWNMVMRFSPKDFIPLQFTGLKDSKGNEIYEGDILNIFNHNQPEVVEWEPHGSGFGFFKHDDSDRMDGNFEFLSHYTGSDGYEVIGNIFENPELLNQ